MIEDGGLVGAVYEVVLPEESVVELGVTAVLVVSTWFIVMVDVPLLVLCDVSP